MESSRRLIRFHLFNCDNTYNLDTVGALLLKMEDKHKFKISVEKRNFRLQQMTEMCESIIPKLQMDFAIFVVHAHESRLSINEDNAGIGYSRIYRALLQVTGGQVLIVIGGDDQYKNEDEEERAVISRWARRKVASQFNEEYLDGRQSFVFSWDKQHREIHEEALLHYFDPSKKGQKFVYHPKPNFKEPKITPPDVDISVKSGPTDNREPLPGGDGSGSSFQRSNGLEGPKTPRVTSDAGTLPEDYPEGTVLLSTRMRYGEISYEGEDVEDWDHRWQPSEKTVHDLRRDWKSVAVAKVMFITNASGGVLCRAQRCKNGFYAWFIATIYFMWEFLLSPQATIGSICRVIEEKSREDGLCANLIAFSLFLLGCIRYIIVFVIAIFLAIWGLLRLCYEWLCKK